MSKKEYVTPAVTRLSFINHAIGEEEFHLPSTPDSEYVVDDSNFVPMSEAVRQLVSGYGAGNKNEQLYDFPDGKDNGSAVPFSRSAAFKDLAELSTELNAQNEKLGQALEEAKSMEEFDKKVKSDITSSTPSPES